MAEVVFIGDLTPISTAEMPPSEFFFSKKRRVVVKRETYQKEGATIKIHKVLLYLHALEEEEFATEVAGSLGDFVTTNQFSESSLKEKLKQKDMLIGKLQNQMKIVEQNVRSDINKEFQQLKSSLDEMQKKSQTSNELVRQLQAKVSLTKKEVVDISYFQTQTLEVHKEL
jgi:hypothetical protein